MIDLPSIIRSYDSNIQTVLSSAWGRRLQTGNIWYPRIVRRRTMDTGVDIIQWLLETASIRPYNTGGRNAFGQQMGLNFSIVAQEYGDHLTLTRMEILNALGAVQNGTEKNALDIAASWSRQMGGWTAWWPQKQAVGIMTSGTNATLALSSVPCYDGQPFFATAHPINAATQSTATVGGFVGGTFTNVFYGRPMNADNYSVISAYIESIPGPDGIARKIKPKIVACGTDNRFNVTQMLGVKSEFFTDPRTGTAAATNITKELYQVEPPIIDADLNCSGVQRGTWWIAAELVEDDTLGPIIYDEREPFKTSAYTDMSDEEIARKEAFEWSHKGWNQVASGHPWLLFQIRPDIPNGQNMWMPP